MLKDDSADAPAATGEGAAGSEGWEKRRAYRRKLPFGRGAVLVVGERAHIVGIADLSVTGAFLRTRLGLRAGDVHLLKLMMLPERTELKLKSQVVRVTVDRDESDHHTRGVAVHFLDVPEEDRARLDAFVGPRR